MTQSPPENAILSAWFETLGRFGMTPAIYSATGEVVRTFLEIGLEAVKIARLLDRIPPKSVVAIQLGNSERWPEVVLALWRRNLIPLPLGDMGPTELAVTLGTCRVAALVTNDGGPLIVHRRPVGDDAAQWLAPVPDFLKLTSGTTNAPRAVRFRADQLLADCEQICGTMGISSHDINFGVIPFSHSYGFSNLILPLLVLGVRLVVSDDRLPRAILDGLAQSRATVFPATPLLFQKLAEMEKPQEVPELRLCISAGAPLSRDTAGAFSVKFRLKVHTFYGASECGGIGYDATEPRRYEDGFVGTPLNGVSVESESDEPGPITVYGTAVGDGYFPDEDPAVLGGRSFIPGDLIQCTERGMYLLGRTSDLINVAGRKLNPLEVEVRLAEFPGVRQVVVFGVKSVLRGEEPVACVVADKGFVSEALLRHCQEHLSPWQMPRDVWVVAEIPATERGKINRRELAESYRTRIVSKAK